MNAGIGKLAGQCGFTRLGGVLLVLSIICPSAPADTTITLVGPSEIMQSEMATFELFIAADPPLLLRAHQITMPCFLPGGTSGSVGYVPPPVIDTGHPDYVFAACGCVTFPIVSVGDCSSQPFDDPRLTDSTMFASDAVTIDATPKYLGEFTFQASADALGSFSVELMPDPYSFLRDPSGAAIPYVAVNGMLAVFECNIDEECNDGLYCNGEETCDAGECQPGANPCTNPDLPVCDEDNDTCVECLLDEHCDDSLPCTTDVCGAGNTCTNTLDMDTCLISEACYDDGGANPANDCEECNSALDPGDWSPSAEGTACGDSDDTDCTDPDTCDGAGTCVPNDAPPETACADDGNDCTVDECDGAGACTHAPLSAGTPCSDDGNECTADECDGAGFCDHPALEAGTPCNDDENDCTADECDGAGMCAHPGEPAGTACGDQTDTDCSDPNSCDGFGSCQSNDDPEGTACPEDGNDCTADECDGTGDCVHPNLDPGTACTDDGNDCTADECDGAGVCDHPPLPPGTECDDNNPCTDDDVCDGEGDCFGVLNTECNDDCDAAVQVFEGVNLGTNETAGPVDDGEAGCQPDSNHDVWFFFDPTCDGEVFMSTTGSEFAPEDDSVLSVYDACGGLEIACDDDSGVELHAALNFYAFSTNRYWIRIAGFQDNVGTIQLNIWPVNDCNIDGVCYAAEAPNPANVCLACIPEVSTTEWTPLPEGTLCGDPSRVPGECDNPDACDGAGFCEPNHKPDGTLCSDERNDCTSDECYSGICIHPYEPAGTVCGDQDDTECDDPNSCNDSGACLDNFAPLDTPCGDPSDTDCDNPDSCDGVGACSENLEVNGTPCEDDGNDCTSDACDGGACDHPPLPAGAPCGNQDDSDCDDPNTCNGVGFCQDNNADNGTPCDDADICTGDDVCYIGACEGTPIPEAPLVDAAGARALEITPQPAGSIAPVALLLTAPNWPCLAKYLAADGTLRDTPFFQTPDDWGTVIATGQDIVPSTAYAIQAECGAYTSQPGIDITWFWGDVNNSGTVDLDDIICVLDGFVGDSACPLESIDLAPCKPDGGIDLDDIIAVLDAFTGVPYPCSEPCM